MFLSQKQENRGFCCRPGLGSSSVMTSDPRLFLFLCSATVIVCLWGKPKACSEDLSSKLPLMSCGLDPCHKVAPKGREDQNMLGWARGHSAQNQCLIVKNVLPISPKLFKSISITYARPNLYVNARVLTAGETVKVVCTDLQSVRHISSRWLFMPN